MPTSFLDLPREIRDIIYGFALTSPTSHLLITLHRTPKHPRSQRSPRSPSRTTAKTTGIRLTPCHPISHALLPSISPAPVALQRASSLIWAETHDWIWKHNRICFANPSDVIAVFKYMGQQPSRLLRMVSLRINEAFGPDKSTLGKALSMLASRTRKGELWNVRLVFEVCDFQLANGALLGEDDTDEAFTYHNNLLDGLRTGEQAGWARLHTDKDKEVEKGWGLAAGPERGKRKVERSLLFDCDVKQMGLDWPDNLWKDNIDIVASELHCAWGGKLICNGAAVWEDHVKIGEVQFPPMWRGV